MLNRRNILKSWLMAIGALLPLSPAKAWAKKIAFKLEKVGKLKEVGGWVILKLKGREVLFVRDAEDSIRALNPACTHQQCTVAYNPDKKAIECPCHRSQFKLDGTQTYGPAPRPLQTYEAEIKGGRVIVSLD